jgi:hypothetical protein
MPSSKRRNPLYVPSKKCVSSGMSTMKEHSTPFQNVDFMIFKLGLPPKQFNTSKCA